MTQSDAGQYSPEVRDADSIDLRALPLWLQEFIERNRAEAKAAKEQPPPGPPLELDEYGEPLTPEGREKRRFLEFLIRLQVHQYAEAYREAVLAATRAERAVAAALRDLNDARVEALREIDRLRAGAATLPDGSLVFPSSSDGRLYREDGEDVTHLRSQARNLSDHSTTREDWHSATLRAQDIEQRTQGVLAYREDKLRPAMERLRDADPELELDELADITRSLKESAPPDVAVRVAEYEKLSAGRPSIGVSVAAEVAEPTDLNAPDIFAQFRAAHDAVPVGSSSPSNQKTSVPAPGKR